MTQHKYALQIPFQADSMSDAEDFACDVKEAILTVRKERILRDKSRGFTVSLWYADPISGCDQLWAEPIKDAEVLAAEREERG